MENLCDVERLAGRDTSQRQEIGAELTVGISAASDECADWVDIVVAEQHAIATDEYLLDERPSWQCIFCALKDGWQRQLISNSRDAGKRRVDARRRGIASVDVVNRRLI